MAGVDRNIRLDRDTVGSTSRSADQPSAPLGTGPAKGLQPLGISAEPEGPETPRGTQQSLVFNPLVLNSAVRVRPPPPTAQGRLEQPRASDSGGSPDEHQRTDARPSVMCRRFTYPDSYQEALWLLDSVRTTRERRRLADHADDTPSSRRSHKEDEETAEAAWKRKELEQYFLGHEYQSRRGPRMDGADSEIQNSEANASGDPQPADVGSAPQNVSALDGLEDTKRHTRNAKPTTSSLNTQLGEVDEVNRQDEMHPSMMYPARVHLYLGRPRSLQEGQRPVPFSLYLPRGLSQETRSENDVGVIDDALRIRRPLQFDNTCAMEKNSRDTPVDESAPDMKTLDTHFRDPGLPSLEGQSSSPGPNNILGQDGATRSPNRGPPQRGYSDENDNNPDTTER